MSEQPPTTPPATPRPSAPLPLDALELLPDTTSDETGAHAGRSDEDYLAERPPHHGD